MAVVAAVTDIDYIAADAVAADAVAADVVAMVVAVDLVHNSL